MSYCPKATLIWRWYHVASGTLHHKCNVVSMLIEATHIQQIKGYIDSTLISRSKWRIMWHSKFNVDSTLNKCTVIQQIECKVDSTFIMSGKSSGTWQPKCNVVSMLIEATHIQQIKGYIDSTLVLCDKAVSFNTSNATMNPRWIKLRIVNKQNATLIQSCYFVAT